MAALSFSAAIAVFAVGGFFTIKFGAFYLIRPITFLRALPIKNGGSRMLLSLGGTVGVGNIVGVCVALSLGGSGAVFWMWVGAFLSMALKYAEIILGMLEREKRDGKNVGGAAYYIKKRLGGFAAAVFSLLLICDCIMMGGVVQSSAIGEALSSSAGISPISAGVCLCITAAAIFFLKVDLFKLSAFLVPFMSIGYAVFSLAVIFSNTSKIPSLFTDILSDAFSLKTAASGGIGILSSAALRQGIVKGLFSNEAGCGTAPSAHADSCEREPCRQALFGVLEVFIDTVVMCTLTAFSVLLTLGDVFGSDSATSLALDAFIPLFGSLAPHIISLFITLFAFCTIISFGYYAKGSIEFLGGGEHAENIFLIIYCISLFIGAIAAPTVIWEICDGVVSLMLIINCTAVVMSHRQIVGAHRRFYVHIGKYASRASRTLSRSSSRIKNAMPMSDVDKNSGETS